ncbi:MAG TPA: hypothetical protein ENK32_12540 [Anaerolineae bacterium]|nr:hypothetical protein [Anaerolineae bacterium]
MKTSLIAHISGKASPILYLVLQGAKTGVSLWVAGFFVDAALFIRIAAGCNPASEMENTLKRVRVVSGQYFSAL